MPADSADQLLARLRSLLGRGRAGLVAVLVVAAVAVQLITWIWRRPGAPWRAVAAAAAAVGWRWPVTVVVASVAAAVGGAGARDELPGLNAHPACGRLLPGRSASPEAT